MANPVTVTETKDHLQDALVFESTDGVETRKLHCEANWYGAPGEPRKLQFLIGEGDANYIILDEQQALDLANWLVTR